MLILRNRICRRYYIKPTFSGTALLQTAGSGGVMVWPSGTLFQRLSARRPQPCPARRSASLHSRLAVACPWPRGPGMSKTKSMPKLPRKSKESIGHSLNLSTQLKFARQCQEEIETIRTECNHQTLWYICNPKPGPVMTRVLSVGSHDVLLFGLLLSVEQWVITNMCSSNNKLVMQMRALQSHLVNLGLCRALKFHTQH